MARNHLGSIFQEMFDILAAVSVTERADRVQRIREHPQVVAHEGVSSL